MLEFFKKNRNLTIAAVVFFLMVVIVTNRSRDPNHANIVDEIFQTLAYPFQAGVSNTFSGATDLFDRYVYLVRLKEENKRMKLEIKALEEELNQYIHGAIQFNLLREQLKFKEQDPERKVYAEVIGESTDNFHHTLLINKGHLAGIRRNYPVVLREGVVGRIQSATALQSVVQLIIDRRHRFPVIVQPSPARAREIAEGGDNRLAVQDRGLVVGRGGYMQVKRIRMLAEVRQKDRVVTSGLAGIFPKGLLVGFVSNLERKQHELFQSANIVPVVDFNKIEGVFIILKDGREATQPFFTEK